MSTPTPDADDRALLEQLAGEHARLGPMEITFRPATVLQLVGLVQLAMRHPSLTTAPESLATAGQFITAARAYFAACPATLELIARGFDPAHDRDEVR